MKLVKFSKDWADELQAEGFRIFTDDAWAAYKKHAEDSSQFYFYFGTNEGWDAGYDDPADVIKNDFEVTDITDNTAIIINNMFGEYGFGIFPDEDCFNDGDDE